MLKSLFCLTNLSAITVRFSMKPIMLTLSVGIEFLIAVRFFSSAINSFSFFKIYCSNSLFSFSNSCSIASNSSLNLLISFFLELTDTFAVVNFSLIFSIYSYLYFRRSVKFFSIFSIRLLYVDSAESF